MTDRGRRWVVEMMKEEIPLLEIKTNDAESAAKIIVIGDRKSVV